MNRNVVILGAGESGVGTAVLAKALGDGVFVSDLGQISTTYKKELKALGVAFEMGKHSEDRILEADVIMKSPGIPDHAPLVLKARALGIPVVSEIEFAYPHTDARIISISGSNGKTTTTLLTHHIMKSAGYNVGLAGNVGFSFARQVAKESFSHYVLELSSFQLDGVSNFKSDVAVLLNITPDHLDRYEYSFDKYATSKMKLGLNQTTADYFVYNADDPEIVKRLKNVQGSKIPFGFDYPIDHQSFGAYVLENKTIQFNLKSKFMLSIADLKVQGKHNVYNSMAAAIASNVEGVRNREIWTGHKDFKNAPHRMEKVATINGVSFINDSKATNVNSTWFGLESLDENVIWLAGGVDKGNDYDGLVATVKDKVKAIICIGEDNRKLIESFSHCVSTMMNISDMREAVMMAYRYAKPGDTVLLSPACASFDFYKNYEERGDRFKRIVKAI